MLCDVRRENHKAQHEAALIDSERYQERADTRNQLVRHMARSYGELVDEAPPADDKEAA
jgi:hypothetical protein